MVQRLFTGECYLAFEAHRSIARVPDLLHFSRGLLGALELNEHYDTAGQQHQPVVATDDAVRSHRSELDSFATNLMYLGDEALLGYLLKTAHVTCLGHLTPSEPYDAHPMGRWLA